MCATVSTIRACPLRLPAKGCGSPAGGCTSVTIPTSRICSRNCMHRRHEIDTSHFSAAMLHGCDSCLACNELTAHCSICSAVDELTYAQELILFSRADLERSIPSMVDGFKPGQRKIMFSCFKRNLKKDIKVGQPAAFAQAARCTLLASNCLCSLPLPHTAIYMLVQTPLPQVQQLWHACQSIGIGGCVCHYRWHSWQGMCQNTAHTTTARRPCQAPASGWGKTSGAATMSTSCTHQVCSDRQCLL